jgi:hypothetical protein
VSVQAFWPSVWHHQTAGSILASWPSVWQHHNCWVISDLLAFGLTLTAAVSVQAFWPSVWHYHSCWVSSGLLAASQLPCQFRLAVLSGLSGLRPDSTTAAGQYLSFYGWTLSAFKNWSPLILDPLRFSLTVFASCWFIFQLTQTIEPFLKNIRTKITRVLLCLSS